MALSEEAHKKAASAADVPDVVKADAKAKDVPETNPDVGSTAKTSVPQESKSSEVADVNDGPAMTAKGVFPPNALVEIACGEEGEEIWMPGQIINIKRVAGKLTVSYGL